MFATAFDLLSRLSCIERIGCDIVVDKIFVDKNFPGRLIEWSYGVLSAPMRWFLLALDIRNRKLK